MCLPGNRKVTPDALGTGMARKAGDAMKSRPEYMQYVARQQEEGQPALPYEQWVKSR